MSDDPLTTFTPEPESPEAARATHIANEFTRFATEIARATRLATSFVATKIATRAATQAVPEALPEPPVPAPRAKTALGEAPPKPPPRPKTRVATAVAKPVRPKTVYAEFEKEKFFEEEPEGEPESPEPDREPEPDLPINTTPTLVERGLALAEVGAEWVGALTQAVVQQAAENFDNELALKKERDARQYHLVVVKGNKSGEYLYVPGAEADEIEKRLRKEGWRVLRTPV